MIKKDEIMTEHDIIEKLNEIKKIVRSEVSNRWLNMDEVCGYSGLSHSTIRRAIRKGSLKVSNRTGRLLFKLTDIDRWLNG
jgi:excisionase family DNA binding protein